MINRASVALMHGFDLSTDERRDVTELGNIWIVFGSD
jgi:hypothetical protein